MNSNKDYYSILGILPTAEAVVIRASYKALAQIYHPDRNASMDAAKIMQDLNEAYGVLGNHEERVRYDALRAKIDQRNEFSNNEDSIDSAFEQAAKLNSDRWTTAIEFYPDLSEISNRLARISPRLAFSFQTAILESKKFETRQQIADSIEAQYLRSYFGTNPAVIQFAKEMMKAARRDVLNRLNKAMVVLGSDIDGEMVVRKIRSEFGIINTSHLRAAKALSLQFSSAPDPNIAMQLINQCGGHCQYQSLEHSFLGFATKVKITVSCIGLRGEFDDEKRFLDWVRTTLIPRLATLI